MTRDSCIFLRGDACLRCSPAFSIWNLSCPSSVPWGSLERGETRVTSGAPSLVPSQAHILIERHYGKKGTQVTSRLRVNRWSNCIECQIFEPNRSTDKYMSMDNWICNRWLVVFIRVSDVGLFDSFAQYSSPYNLKKNNNKKVTGSVERGSNECSYWCLSVTFHLRLPYR